MNRRDFLTSTAAVATALPFTIATSSFAKNNNTGFKYLILGGRDFFGPTLVNTLLASGNQVTLFNRGFTNPELFPELKWIRGDREVKDGSGLSNLKEHLKNHNYDVVIDTWQKSPVAIREMIKLIKGKIGRYQYVSSISVYKDRNTKNITEEYPLVDLSNTNLEDRRLSYAKRKTWAETLLFQELGEAAVTFRSHGMRSDRTPDRIYEPYWPARMLKGGEIVFPLDDRHMMQVCDVKSMSKFMSHTAVEGGNGAFNIALQPSSFKGYIDEVDKVTQQPHRKMWIPKKFLNKFDIEPYRDLPLWRPQLPGFYHINVNKALKAGLKNRSLSAMVTDQLSGYLKRNPENDFMFGAHGTIGINKERQILSAWNSYNKV